MKTVQGNLITMGLNGEFDVIVHCANCWNMMKSGIAKEISERIPEAVAVDKKTIPGDKSKLGQFTRARIYLDEHKIRTLDICNVYGQYNYGRDKINIDYEATRNGFKLIKQYYTGKRIGYNLFGCGLAGGDWNIVSKIIDEELSGEDHTFVEFKPE